MPLLNGACGRNVLVPVFAVSGLILGFSVYSDKRCRDIRIKLHFGAGDGNNKEVGWTDKGWY